MLFTLLGIYTNCFIGTLARVILPQRNVVKCIAEKGKCLKNVKMRRRENGSLSNESRKEPRSKYKTEEPPKPMTPLLVKLQIADQNPEDRIHKTRRHRRWQRWQSHSEAWLQKQKQLHSLQAQLLYNTAFTGALMCPVASKPPSQHPLHGSINPLWQSAGTQRLHIIDSDT